MQNPELYEQKVIKDKEFPVQMHINTSETEGYYFRDHWHEHLELHYVLEGNPVFYLNQRKIDSREGNLVIVNSNVIHSGACDGHPIRVLVLIFEMESFSREFANQRIVFQPLVEKDPRIDEVMKTLYREMEEKRLGWQLSCKGEIFRLITHLAREYAKETMSERESEKRMRKLERLNTVLDYIHAHYGEKISNQQLAQVAHLSVDRFNHLFKESMDVSPLQYVNEVRLKKAMLLLKEEEDSIARIGERAGFTDYNHFCRQFRAYYGCTPSEVRK